MAIKATRAQRAEMALLEEFFLAQQAPLTFNPYNADNVVMAGERSFEQVCLNMQEAGLQSPKKMTEFEFYNAILFFQNKYEKMNNGTG